MERFGSLPLPHRSGDHDLTKRQFLLGQAAIGVAGVAAAGSVVDYALRHGSEKNVPRTANDNYRTVFEGPNGLPQELPGQNTGVTVESIVQGPEWWRRQYYPVSKDLAGQAINPLELTYVKPAEGGVLPAKDAAHPDMPAFPELFPPIDFAANLDDMHSRKLEIAFDRGAPDERSQKETFARLGQDYRRTWERNEIRRMDLKEFRALVEQQSNEMLTTLAPSFDRIARTYFGGALSGDTNLSEDRKKEFLAYTGTYLEWMAKHITPEIMMTYMAVELMPSRERSAGLLEFLTKNAGVEYLAAIPALGDKLLSYGPFQLTKFVIHPGRERTITSGTDEHKKEQVVIEGQGDVTRLLSVIGRSDVLPDSLTEFSTIEEHIRAGYLFAFNNVLALVANAIEDKRYDDLTGIAESVTGGSVFGSSTVFPEFVSAAHHRPEVARKAFERWLDANKKRKPLSRDTSLQAFFPSTAAGQQVRTYAEKAKTISKVLRPYLR